MGGEDTMGHMGGGMMGGEDTMGHMGGGMMCHGMKGHGMMGHDMFKRMIFALMDTDGDGTISLEEFQTAHGAEQMVFLVQAWKAAFAKAQSLGWLY